MTVIVKARRLRGRAVITHAAGLAIVLAAVAAAGPSAPVISVPAIASGSVVAAPTVRVDQRIGVPAILGDSRVSAPTIAAGSASVAPATIASTSVVRAPVIARAGSATIASDVLASAAVVPSPMLSVGAIGIEPATIASTAAVRAPIVATGAVGIAPVTIASGSAVTAPVVTPGQVGVQPASIASIAAFYAPVVALQGAAYDTDAQSYFAAMTVQPDATRKGLINDLIVGLKADGLWTRIDRLSILGSGTQQQALLDVRSPSKSAAASNSPFFTADRGFTGDGAGAFIDFGEPWAFSGASFSLNSASLFVWCNQAASTGIKGQIGNTGAYRSGINVRQGSGNNTFNLNDSTPTAYTASGVSTGFRCISRSDANTKRAYTNGNLITTASVQPTAASTTNGCALRATSSYTDARLALAGSGGNFTDAEQAALYNRFNTFLTAIGAT